MKEPQSIHTRMLIKEALLVLLETNSLDSISVKRLCDKAGVHRSTFYNHFSSLEEVMFSIQDDFLNAVSTMMAEAQANDQKSVLERVTLVFGYIKEHQKATKLLLDDAFLCRLLALPKLEELLMDRLESSEDGVAVRQFALGGSIRLINMWIDEHCPTTAQDEAKLILSLARRVCV